ncbi:hypothetical protein TRVL_08345 [Trypanosoma vivax]|nr:hypothetical protein TRVL_08345 [Trypanosoma vivax]
MPANAVFLLFAFLSEALGSRGASAKARKSDGQPLADMRLSSRGSFRDRNTIFVVRRNAFGRGRQANGTGEPRTEVAQGRRAAGTQSPSENGAAKQSAGQPAPKSSCRQRRCGRGMLPSVFQCDN